MINANEIIATVTAALEQEPGASLRSRQVKQAIIAIVDAVNEEIEDKHGLLSARIDDLMDDTHG